MPLLDLAISFEELQTLIAGDIPPDSDLLDVRIDQQHRLVYLHFRRGPRPLARSSGCARPSHL